MLRKIFGEPITREIDRSFKLSEDEKLQDISWELSDQTLSELEEVAEHQRRAEKTSGNFLLK